MPKQITEIEIEARIAPASTRWPGTAIHWEKLKEAVAAVRALITAVDANCRAVEQDGDLSPEGVARKRVEIGRRAVGELAAFAPLRSAEAAVSSALSIFEAAMTNLPKPPASGLDVALAEEVRAHLRGQENPVGFVLNHLDDGRVVGAVLHAPGFLSGLTDEALNIVRDRARSALHPEHVQQRRAAEDALKELQRGLEAARRLVLARTETRFDRDGQVRGVSEPVPGGIAA